MLRSLGQFNCILTKKSRRASCSFLRLGMCDLVVPEEDYRIRKFDDRVGMEAVEMKWWGGYGDLFVVKLRKGAQQMIRR